MVGSFAADPDTGVGIIAQRFRCPEYGCGLAPFSDAVFEVDNNCKKCLNAAHSRPIPFVQSWCSPSSALQYQSPTGWGQPPTITRTDCFPARQKVEAPDAHCA